MQIEKGYIPHNFWQLWSKEAGKLSFPKPIMKLNKFAKDEGQSMADSQELAWFSVLFFLSTYKNFMLRAKQDT